LWGCEGEFLGEIFSGEAAKRGWQTASSWRSDVRCEQLDSLHNLCHPRSDQSNPFHIDNQRINIIIVVAKDAYSQSGLLPWEMVTDSVAPERIG
jgi:hypothetical protein